jgi:hypothetical protein
MQKETVMLKQNSLKFLLGIFALLFLCVPDAKSQDVVGGPPAGAERRATRRTFRLQLEVVAGADKVEGAKVILESAEDGVRFTKETRTNREGTASASSVPEGRLRIQVVARECETFGEVITLTQDNQTHRITLTKRPGAAAPPN